MILLVEDNVISRTDFAETLRKFGYEVLEANDGRKAITLLEQHASDVNLVVTDMVMPGINGLTLVKNIEARWPKIPVIMVSAYLSADGGHKILGDKVDFLPKPILPSALIASVGRVIPRHD